MKHATKLLAMVTVLIIVLAACTSVIEEKDLPAADGQMKTETEDKNDSMADKDMEDDMKDDMKEEDQHGMASDMAMDNNDGVMAGDMMEPSVDDMENTMANQGIEAPIFDYVSMDGDSVTLEDYAGEKLYVKYWASWCPICLSGLEELDALSGSATDFQVITVVTPGYGGEKDMEAFKAWFAEKGTENMVVLFDQDGTYAKEFGVRGYPTSAYIGSDGVLVSVVPGHVSNGQIQEKFADIY